MKKFLLILLISIYSLITYSQIADKSFPDGQTILLAKEGVEIYTDSFMKNVLKNDFDEKIVIYKNTKVRYLGVKCCYNELSGNKIKIDYSTHTCWGWSSDFMIDKDYIKSVYIQDSITKSELKAKAISVYIQDSITKSELKAIAIKDSIYKALLDSKQFWITNVSVIDYSRNSQGISVTFLNNSLKKVKYINFTVIPYNAVDDIVTDDMNHNYKSCQLIGPIDVKDEATYYNEILFFTSIIHYYKLSNISVQYMDNTIKYFSYPDVLLKKY